MKSRFIDLKGYIDGIPVTVISATCSGMVGGSALGMVTVLPQKSMLVDEINRGLVHIFYKEDDDVEWKIFMEGEIYGISYSKSPQKSVVLNIVDLSNYMNAAQLYLFNFETYKATSQDPNGAVTLSNYLLTYYDFATKIRATAITEGLGQILDLFGTLLANLKNINTFFSSADTRLRISDRLINYSDSVMVKKFCSQQNYGFQALLKGTIEQLDSASTLLDMAKIVMNIIFYQVISNPISLYAGDKGGASNPGIKNMLFIPQSPFSPPPMCNIIFPGESDGYMYSRQFNLEPTRMSFETPQATTKDDNSHSAAGGMTVIHAPSKLDNMIKSFKSQGEQSINLKQFEPGAGTYADLAKDNMEALTNEELVKGVIKVAVPETMLSPFYTPISNQAIADTWQNICDYFYFSYRYSQRSMQLTLPFRPGIVAGFPMAYLDADMTMLGNIVSYEHTISKRGGKTTITCSHTHTDKDIICSYQPPIFSTDWNIDKIGTAIYANLFDCNSVVDAMGTTGVKEATDKIKSEYQKYLSKGMGLDYAAQVTKRRIPTEAQIFNFIGAWDAKSEKPNPKSNAFATLIKDGISFWDRQSIIMEYLAAVSNKGLLG